MTTRLTLKRAVTGAAITVSALVGTLGITTALNAGEAAAAVDSGRYLMTGQLFGLIPSKNIVTVRGNRLHTPGAPDLILHSTPHGAYADSGITRYVFTKRGNGYSGRLVVGPAQVGNVQLIKR